jgi:hypothetical protein
MSWSPALPSTPIGSQSRPAAVQRAVNAHVLQATSTWQLSAAGNRPAPASAAPLRTAAAQAGTRILATAGDGAISSASSISSRGDNRSTVGRMGQSMLDWGSATVIENRCGVLQLAQALPTSVCVATWPAYRRHRSQQHFRSSATRFFVLCQRSASRGMAWTKPSSICSCSGRHHWTVALGRSCSVSRTGWSSWTPGLRGGGKLSPVGWTATPCVPFLRLSHAVSSGRSHCSLMFCDNSA